MSEDEVREAEKRGREMGQMLSRLDSIEKQVAAQDKKWWAIIGLVLAWVGNQVLALIGSGQ